jgi:small subunit ribosomal protein S16
MAVVLRLKRAGAKKRPFYRVVAADSRRQRDGRFLEIIGHYDPLRTPSTLVLEKEQIEKWLKNGAQPSTQVASLMRQAGMAWTRASAPKKNAAAKAGSKSGAKKRGVKRTVSARKVKKKVARKTASKTPKAASKAPAKS